MAKTNKRHDEEYKKNIVRDFSKINVTI